MKTSYTHDTHGRLVSATNESGTTSYAYDLAGNRVSVSFSPSAVQQARGKKGTVLVDPEPGRCAFCGAAMAPANRACTSCGKLR